MGEIFLLHAFCSTCRTKSDIEFTVVNDPTTGKPEGHGTCPNCNSEVVYLL